MDQLSIPVPTCSVNSPLRSCGNAGGELDVFEAARHFALSVGEHLAVFGGDDAGELIDVLLEELAEAEHHACAAQRRLRGPRGKRSLRGGDRSVELGSIGQGNQSLHLAGGGVVNLRGAARGTGDGFSVDPVWNCAQVCGGVRVNMG
jgi:hypothetical protein